MARLDSVVATGRFANVNACIRAEGMSRARSNSLVYLVVHLIDREHTGAPFKTAVLVEKALNEKES